MTQPRVRIEEVTVPPIRPDRIVAFELDQPRPDATVVENSSDIYALRIRGWAIGAGQPVTDFELVHRGLVLESAPSLPGPDDQPAARFELAVSSLDLPYAFDIALRAVLEDQTRTRLATLSGTRAALPGAPASGPSPTLIVTVGRSGSTALANLLCHHPDLAGYRTWEAETRVISYWTSVLRALARPASYERQLAPAGPVIGTWWVGDQPPPGPHLPDEALELPALGREGVQAVAAFCRSRIEVIGSSLAAAAGKPDARYFVEKASTDPVRSTAETSEELDPRTREIVLVRDVRDVACSMAAYSRRTGVSFGPYPDASMQDTLRWMSTSAAAGLADYAQRRSARAHLLRYEDLIMQPETALTDVLEYIGADAAPQTVALMLERLAAETEHRRDHATTDSTKDSVGRWRRELDADEQALAEELLRPQLDAFGYE
jgi:hypothetical protein